jgi:hypothetical protein
MMSSQTDIDIVTKYPDKIPIIIIQKDDYLPKLVRNKYLVGKTTQISHLLVDIKKQLKMSLDKVVYLHINGNEPSVSATFEELYELYKDNDGILRIHLSGSYDYVAHLYKKMNHYLFGWYDIFSNQYSKVGNSS